MPRKFVLIGSGLAGGLMAAYLGRRGYEVELYERRGDPREGNIIGGPAEFTRSNNSILPMKCCVTPFPCAAV